MPNKPLQILSSVLLIAVIVVVVLGAYTRLVHAGLGCPDWPTCYGHLWVPDTQEEIHLANQNFADTPVEQDKTWPEQIHRIFASSLGVIILLCFFIVNAQHALRSGSSKLNTASGLLIILVLATILRIALGPAMEPILAFIAFSYFANLARIFVKQKTPDSGAFILISLLAGLVILQGLFGMWTVTLKLWPQVVTAHLLGGFTVLSLIALFWKQMTFGKKGLFVASRKIKILSLIALATLIAQIALGGWVSSNYAALACPDLPLCQNELLPDADFSSGFNVLQKIGPNYLGGQLDNTARIAIHLSHRLGAVFVCVVLVLLISALLRLSSGVAKRYGIALAGALCLQLSLGISNIVFALPLSIAVLHNAGGALLLVTLIFTLSAQKTKVEKKPEL